MSELVEFTLPTGTRVTCGSESLAASMQKARAISPAAPAEAAPKPRKAAAKKAAASGGGD